MKLTPSLRKHIMVVIIALYILYRFVITGYTLPPNYVRIARQHPGQPVDCSHGRSWYPAQYLAAPEVLDECRR